MTTTAWLLAALAAAFAVGDWVLVQTGRGPQRWVTKPLSMVFLIGVAASLEPIDDTIRTWMVVGLVLSLIGDVCLQAPERFFVFGLASFLLGHLAYIVAMQTGRESWAWTAVGLALVAVAIAVVGRAVVSAVKGGDHPEMAGPVIAYLVVISAMVVSAFGTTATWAIIGACLFYASDATLAWNRFVTPLTYGPLAVMVTYHAAQFSLVAWLVV